MSPSSNSPTFWFTKVSVCFNCCLNSALETVLSIKSSAETLYLKLIGANSEWVVTNIITALASCWRISEATSSPFFRSPSISISKRKTWWLPFSLILANNLCGFEKTSSFRTENVPSETNSLMISLMRVCCIKSSSKIYIFILGSHF